AVGGESISAAGRRPSFSAPGFFTAASVRGPSSLNLLFGLPRILIRLGPHSTAYAGPGPFFVTAFTSPGHESGCRSLAHRPQARSSAATLGFLSHCRQFLLRRWLVADLPTA